MLEGSTCSLGLLSRLAVSSCALDDQSLRFSFGPRVPASRLEYRRSIAGVSLEYRWSNLGAKNYEPDGPDERFGKPKAAFEAQNRFC